MFSGSCTYLTTAGVGHMCYTTPLGIDPLSLQQVGEFESSGRGCGRLSARLPDAAVCLHVMHLAACLCMISDPR